uniref:Aa_trans domain-containing protein n=1 Tax=Echinostoma caproni TaxID=27848 RepID=A0A183AVP4_9TREM
LFELISSVYYFFALIGSRIINVWVACFAVCMCPFLFFHVTRSRWLQISTTAIRWISFLLMLCLAVDHHTLTLLNASHAWNPAVHPLMFEPNGIPNMFGVCVYVFMCHHSIPGTVTPIRNKRRIMIRLFLPLFFSVFAFNMLLSGTAVAAFNEIKDLYTLNFVPNEQASKTFRIPFVLAQIFGYFLALFPVFALSSTFPILGCTLLGNLSTLCNMFPVCHSPKARHILRFTLPFIVLFPPIIIALLTDDIGFLVGFTGAFAGTGIQYVIPAVLVYKARRYMSEPVTEKLESYSSGMDDKQMLCPSDEVQTRTATSRSRLSGCFSALWKTPWKKVNSPHASPFQHVLWIVGLMIWSVVCLVIVLVDKIHPL